MRVYRWLYIIGAIAATIISAGYFSLGIQDKQWVLIAMSCGLIFLWWYAFYRIEKGSITLSLLLTGLVCCLILFQLYERRQFVIRNGGWERADGYGSPLAFLLGLIFELFWFLYFFGTTMCGLRVALSKRNELAVAVQTSDNEAD